MAENIEEQVEHTVGIVGTIGGLGSLLVVSAVAASTVLTRSMNMESPILPLILQWGPGIASVLGGASSFATYYGWFRILRKKKKLSKKEEGKGEAQNQLTDFIQSLPEMFKSIGCFPQLVTAALGASLIASAITYTSVAENLKEAIEERLEKIKPVPKEIIPEEKENPLNMNIIGKLNMRIKEGETLEETIATLLIRRGWSSNAVIELLQNKTVVSTTKSDEEGNYAFMNMPPGEYKVRVKLSGYKEVKNLSQHGKWDVEMAPENEPNEYARHVVNIPFIEKPKEAIQEEPQQQQQQASIIPPPSAPPPPPPPPAPWLLWSNQPPPPPPPPPPARPANMARTRPPPKAESNFFAGLGSEHNSNAQKGTALGGHVMLGYDLNKHFALGLNAVRSMDLDKEGTMESTVMLRYYLPVKGPFVQAEAGGSLNKQSGEGNIEPMGGVAAGWRLNVVEGWFLEPAVRGGYPSVWGTGITVGKKFGGE
ncbi:MAG: carboxypeptidase-like regulatory domain-containing protein [Fibromonadaceae bacterium]|nr:carboxypeptidase-like regulatory domain-containing protein [Fibromonadaceae bacterium]